MPSSSAHHSVCSAEPQRESERQPSQTSYERHRRKCQICRHPGRDAIEADFIEWRHPNQIHEDYDVDYHALYRHARATGLLERRRENLSIVVQKVLEEAEYVEAPSAFAILRAVRTLACLNERGQWTEPPTTHVVVNATAPPAQSPAPTTSGTPRESNEPLSESLAAGHSPVARPERSRGATAAPNRNTYEKLEPGVSDSKQTSQVISNRNSSGLYPR